MIASGPSGSIKTECSREVRHSSIIDLSPENLVVLQPMATALRGVEKGDANYYFYQGIPDHLNDDKCIDAEKRHLIVFKDFMTEAKCDQCVAVLFTKGSNHRNLSVIYLTQNLFPQGKVCRDIALNTQYLVLFNNPIDRQQVATLAKRIYPSSSASFMRRFEETKSRPYGYLVVDLKASTPERDCLHTNIFEANLAIEEWQRVLNRESPAILM